MDRREFLGDLAASSALLGVACGIPLPGGSHALRWVVITEQRSGRHLRVLLPAAERILLAANELLDPYWHSHLRTQRVLGAVGAANAVLLLESLRDRRAAFSYAGRDPGLAAARAGLPAGMLGAIAGSNVEFIVAALSEQGRRG